MHSRQAIIAGTIHVAQKKLERMPLLTPTTRFRRAGRALVLLLCAMASVADAAPAAEPGDVGLRHDIQVLADYGAIRSPVSTWPMSWDALLEELERTRAEDVVLPNRVMPTYRQAAGACAPRNRPRRARFHASLGGAEKPAIIRSFSATPRERGEARAGVSFLSEHFSIDLNVTGVDAPRDGKNVRPDGSQVALDVGNWSVAASTLERWWGPGWDGSLILSNNARPFPALTIDRNSTAAFDTKWLSWIGPWDLSVIFGQLEKERAVPDTRFFGVRANFRPHPSLEFGISRSAQWCGDGRPCGFDTFTDLLLGKDNVGDAGITRANEPGNQMGGFDARWTTLWLGTPVSLYGQMIGEDEAGGFPSRYLAQFGIEGSGVTHGRKSYRWFAEIAGTSCDFVSRRSVQLCVSQQPVSIRLHVPRPHHWPRPRQRRTGRERRRDYRDGQRQRLAWHCPNRRYQPRRQPGQPAQRRGDPGRYRKLRHAVRFQNADRALPARARLRAPEGPGERQQRGRCTRFPAVAEPLARRTWTGIKDLGMIMFTLHDKNERSA